MPAMLGASLLSAAASLPLHLLPLLIVSVIADGGLSTVQAGMIATACMLGQMLMALALPSLGVRRLSRPVAALAACTGLLALGWSVDLRQQALLLPWFVIGAAGGALQFLGATSAAAAKDRAYAFSLRLTVTLLVSGVVVAGLQFGSGFFDYAAVAVQFSVLFAVLTGAGLCLYRAPAPMLRPRPACTEREEPQRRLAGLAVVFLLFVGQPGFWAFAVQGVQQRGVVLEGVVFAIAGCKIVAALALFWIASRPQAIERRAGQLLWPGLGAAAGVAGMALASGAWSFFAAMLLWGSF